MRSRFFVLAWLAGCLVLATVSRALALPTPSNVILIGVRQPTPTLSLEEQMVRALQERREAHGLKPESMLILQYHLDVSEERRYCKDSLHINPEDTVFVGVVRTKVISGAPAPIEVIARFPRVSDPESQSRRVFDVVSRERQRNPNVALLVVSDRTVGASSQTAFRRARGQENFLKGVIAASKSSMQASGYPPEMLNSATVTLTEIQDLASQVQIGEADLPLVALAGVDATGRPTGFVLRINQADKQGVEATTMQVVNRWNEVLSANRRPQTYHVTLRGPNGQYVFAEKGGGGKLICKSNQTGEQELFSLVDTNGFALQNGDPVSFRTSGTRWISAEDGGGKQLLATGAQAGSFETFTIVKIDPSTGPVIRSGDKVAFRSQGGRYWTAEDGGGSKLNCKGQALGPWEAFIIDVR